MSLSHWVKVVARHPRPIRLIAARFLQHTGLSPLFTISLDGYALRFYPTNVSANLWIDPASRFHDLSLFADYCASGDAIVDVGANIGEVSIVCGQRVGRDGRVFAFEPHPRIFRYLQGNLALNGRTNVTPRNVALGAQPGSVRMSDDRRDDMNRLEADGAILVPCSTLDAEIKEPSVALLKIDVEGAELQVLQGAAAVLRRTACVNCELIAEHTRRFGYRMRDVIALLEQAGFEAFLMDGPRRLRRVGATFAESGAHELVAIRDVDDFIRRTRWDVAS